MEIQLSGNVNETLDQIDLAFQEGQGYEIINTILQIKKVAGIALAKALWLGHRYWGNEDETFRDYAVREYGIRSETVKRYTDVWEMILSAPESLREFLVRKPMQELIPIGTNIASGLIEPDDEDWNRLMLATGGEVPKLVGEMSGRETVDRLSLYIDMKTGEIESWYRDNREYVGFLDVHRIDVDQVGKSIYRIVNKSGLGEKE